MGERARTLAIPDAAERIARLIAEVAGPEARRSGGKASTCDHGAHPAPGGPVDRGAGPATDLEYLPLRVAAAEGYFAEEKLSVTLETLRAEPLAAQALGRGRVALAATSLDAALSLGDAGSAPPRLVFGLTVAPPVALLVPAAKKDSVKTLADLAGKTIGISAPGTPGALALFSLLADEGIGRAPGHHPELRRAGPDRSAQVGRDRGGHGAGPRGVATPRRGQGGGAR